MSTERWFKDLFLLPASTGLPRLYNYLYILILQVLSIFLWAWLLFIQPSSNSNKGSCQSDKGWEPSGWWSADISKGQQRVNWIPLLFETKFCTEPLGNDYVHFLHVAFPCGYCKQNDLYKNIVRTCYTPWLISGHCLSHSQTDSEGSGFLRVVFGYCFVFTLLSVSE